MCTSTSQAAPIGKVFETATRRGSGRRCHYTDRHAFEQHSRNNHGSCTGNEANGSPQEMLGQRGILGRCRPREFRGELRALGRAGVFGFKCFLVPSGVAEFENAEESDLRKALPKLAAMDLPLLVHAELPGPIEEETRKLAKADPRKYKTWLRSRPPAAENKAIEMLVGLARRVQVMDSYRSPVIGAFGATDSAGKTGGAPDHRGNLPALSIFFFGIHS